MTALACAGAVATLTSAFAAEAAPKGVHTGSAYGSMAEVNVGPLAGKFGTTAFIAMPCLGTDGAKRSSDSVSLSVGLLGVALRANTIVSTVQTTTDGSKTTDEVTSRIEGVKALSGLISADAIVAVSRTVASRRSVTSDDLGTSFVNLKIAGQSIPVDVPANTAIDLPGFGVATLKRETFGGDGADTSSLAVDMIAVEITVANALGIPVGTELVIGHAESGFQRGLPDVVYSGDAYATLAVVNVVGVGSAGAGATALQSVACTGTGGDTLTKKIAGLNIDGLLSSGAAATQVYASNKVARTSAKLERISLLGGLVTITSLKCVALTRYAGGRRIRSTDGTAVVGLKVLGLPIATPNPNITVDLPGLGVLTVNEQVLPDEDSKADTVVNAIRIHITKNNLLGLPVGAKIIVGHATAGVTPTKKK